MKWILHFYLMLNKIVDCNKFLSIKYIKKKHEYPKIILTKKCTCEIKQSKHLECTIHYEWHISKIGLMTNNKRQ